MEKRAPISKKSHKAGANYNWNLKKTLVSLPEKYINQHSGKVMVQ
jgi:hypothetical protein